MVLIAIWGCWEPTSGVEKGYTGVLRSTAKTGIVDRCLVRGGGGVISQRVGGMVSNREVVFGVLFTFIKEFQEKRSI